jgi:hypothetical protein
MTTAATKPASATDSIHWDPVMDEVGLPHDPDNLYVQTVSTMLNAAEMIDLKHRTRIILAQPKNEIMVHFPVKMDDGHHKLSRATASSTTTPAAPTRAASATTRMCTSTMSRASRCS